MMMLMITKRPILCATFFLMLVLLSMMGTAHGFLHNKHSSFIRTTPSSKQAGSFLQVPDNRANGGHKTTKKKAVLIDLETAAATAALDPSVEAEVCTTMAHVALDFTSLASPSRSLMRLFAVIGRLLAITADYLPDHSISTEELVIQVFLLSFALRELLSDNLAGAFATAQAMPDNVTTNSAENNV